MRVRLRAGEGTSRDVASCVGGRQERWVMLRTGVEPEDSADTNAERMPASVDASMASTELGRGREMRILSVPHSGCRDDEDKCRHDDAVEKMAPRDVAN